MTHQNIYAFRLHPGRDLKKELLAFAKKEQLKAAYIITCVGSLKTANLRMAQAQESKSWDECMEIVSLVGTFSAEACHLHIALSDNTGATFGGHLLDGCQIHTTAEIIVGEAFGLEFTREQDLNTGYLELNVRKLN